MSDKANTLKFLSALADLMDKYNITAITADDEYDGYPECGQDIQIRIDSDDYSFDPGFGKYMWPGKIRKTIEESK